MRPDLLPLPYRIWIAVCGLMALGLAVVILMPTLTDALVAQGEGAIAQFTAPARFRLAVLFAIAVLAGVSVIWILLRDRVLHPIERRDAALRELLLVAVALFPAFALVADRAVVPALIALVPAVALLVLSHVPRLRASDAGLAWLGVIATVTWLTLLFHQTTERGERSDSWLWVSLFGVTAAFAAFGSYYGVARAAESRSSKLGFLYRADLHPLLVLGILIACAAVVALRLTVARDVFPDPDPELWSPFGRSALSWAIAATVGGLIVVVSVRASRRPLTRFGERRVVAALAVLGNLHLVLSVAVIAAGMVIAATTGAISLPVSWLDYVPVMKLIGVVLLGLIVPLPRFRGTAARWIGLITALFLIPQTIAGVIDTSGLVAIGPLDDFPASPVQVLLIVLAAAFALAIWNLVRPSAEVIPSLVTRLAVVPLIAVHAGWLLPAAWSDLGRVVIVVGVLVALFWLMPPAAADRSRHAYDVLGVSAAQVLALAVFVLAIPTLFQDGTLVVLGLLWLSIPIIAALTIDTIERPDASKVHSHPRSRSLTEDT
ncbi:MAG: hypothetical protein ABIQ01_06630 [Pseudolysinimonas sp.]